MSMQEDVYVPPRYVPKPDTFWTEAKVDALRKMIGVGVRGNALREALGCNRSMLYSKLGRLGILLGKKQAQPKPRAKKTSRGAFSFNQQTLGEPLAPGIMELPDEVSDAAVSLADLDVGKCRWPISGEGPNMMFCGAGADHSYCARHHNIAYRGKRNA